MPPLRHLQVVAKVPRFFVSPIWDSIQTGGRIGPGFRVGQPRNRATVSLPVADMARRHGGTERPRAISLAVLSHRLLEDDGFHRHPHQGRRPGPGETHDGISERIHGGPSSAKHLQANGAVNGVQGVALDKRRRGTRWLSGPTNPRHARCRLDVAPGKDPR